MSVSRVSISLAVTEESRVDGTAMCSATSSTPLSDHPTATRMTWMSPPPGIRHSPGPGAPDFFPVGGGFTQLAGEACLLLGFGRGFRPRFSVERPVSPDHLITVLPPQVPYKRFT